MLLSEQPGLATGYKFQSPQQAANSGAYDVLPTSLAASNGTLWLAWETVTSTRADILYKTFNGIFWTSARNLTGNLAWVNNISPSLTQLSNGTIMMVWASNPTGHYNLYYELLNKNVWSKPFQLTSGSFTDQLGKTLVAPDSTLWVFWQRDWSSSTCLSSLCRQIFYKTLTGGQWSQDVQVTTDLSTWNAMPSIMKGRDGRTWLAYSKWQSRNSGYNVFYRAFDGNSWSGEVPLTSTSNSDTAPSIYQDRNGTIWLFWSRDVPLNSTVSQFKIYYKFSPDSAATWSADTQLTFGGDVNRTIDDRQPFVTTWIDKSLYIFYSSNALGNGSAFDIYYIRTDPVYPVHAVAVTSLQVSPTKIFSWYVTTVTVTVSDLGDFNENISVTVQAVAGSTFNIGSASSSLTIGGSRTFSFTWNATSAPPARYTIVATMPLVPGETLGNGAGNTLKFNTLNVYIPGDMDKSGCVGTLDASILLYSYGSKPGSAFWNPDADLNRDGVVNIIDLGMWGNSFGKCI
jgi:hypothetical protein